MSASLNEPFVPLASGPTAKDRREDFRVLVAERPEKARPISSLALVAGNCSTDHVSQAAGEPKVTLQRDGNCITGIRVQCSCGQIIDLKCGYQSDPSP